MRKLVLENNRKTTLTETLLDTDFSFPYSLLADNIIGVGFTDNHGEFERVVTLTDDTAIEIISIIHRNETGCTILRGQENTVVSTWPAGTKFELRLTAGMIMRMAQVDNIGYDHAWLERGIATAVANEELWEASSPSLSIMLLKDGPDFTYALYALNDSNGTTAGVAPDPSALAYNSGLILDNTVLWLYIKLTPSGDLDAYLGIRIGTLSGNSMAHNSGLAISDSQSFGDSAIAIGQQNTNYGHFSTVLGCNIVNFADNALIMASGRVADRGQNVKNGFIWNYIPSKPQGLSYFDAGEPYQTGLDGIIWSPLIDFANTSVWAANTPLQTGSIRRPTVANGRQYIWYDLNYQRHYGRQEVGYSFGSTGPTQPSWPTSFGAKVEDGDGEWVCVGNDYINTGLGNTPFLVKEVGILIHEYQSVTAQPFVSVGHLGNQNSILNNTQTTLLNGANKAQIFTIVAPFMAGGIQWHIRTLATGAGARMIGQFWLRGHIVPAYR